MRHLVRGKKLGRNTSHRVATMKALSCSLIKNKTIQTTVAKAKELRKYIEPVITRAKEDTTHNRRQVFSSLQDKHAVSILFDEIAPEVGDRPGGYTRVLKLGFRLGDSAEMALIELVDFSDYQPEKKSAKKKRTRRAGRSNKPDTSDEKVSEKKEDGKTKSEEKTAPEKEEADVEEKQAEDIKEESSEEVKTKGKEEAEASGENKESKNSVEKDESDDSDKEEVKK